MGILVLVVVLVVAVVLFSVQNASPVAVTFLFWGFDASLAIVIFLSLVIGIILGAAIVMAVRRQPRARDTTAGQGHPQKPDPSGNPGSSGTLGS